MFEKIILAPSGRLMGNLYTSGHSVSFELCTDYPVTTGANQEDAFPVKISPCCDNKFKITAVRSRVYNAVISSLVLGGVNDDKLNSSNYHFTAFQLVNMTLLLFV